MSVARIASDWTVCRFVSHFARCFGLAGEREKLFFFSSCECGFRGRKLKGAKTLCFTAAAYLKAITITIAIRIWRRNWHWESLDDLTIAKTIRWKVLRILLSRSISFQMFIKAVKTWKLKSITYNKRWTKDSQKKVLNLWFYCKEFK